MELKLVGDRVLVEPFEIEDTTEAGLSIPESAQEDWVESTVAAVGSGEEVQASPICVGDDVIFHKEAAVECTVRGNEYYILALENVLLIVE